MALGLSAFADGLYDVGDWGIAAVAVLALLVAAVIAGIPRLRPRAVAAAAALSGLWLWSWLSTGWAESADQALEGAGRWLFYAALLTALVLLVRDRRVGLWLLAAATGGVLIAAVYVVIEMTGEGSAELFLGARLSEPLGYVNGQAAYFFIGAWPLLALAEASRRSWVGGLAVVAAIMLAGLVVLSQTRAVLPGMIVTTAVVVAVVPGRLRRLALLACIAAGLALALDPLLEVYRDANGVTDVAEVQDAARMLLIGAIFGGGLWVAAELLVNTATRRSHAVARWLPRAGTAMVAAIAGLALLVATVKGGDIADSVERQYDEFVHLKAAEGASRFTTGGGVRYDYWRVAWKQFGERPIVGYGAGNYDRTYFVDRRTNEDIRQPHSIELQTLAELGLVGGAILVAFIAAVLMGFARAARAARTSRAALATAVGGGGAFIAWLTHTSVDWLHVIPGLMGIALVAAALLLAPRERQRTIKLGLRAQLATVAAVALVAVVGGVGVGRLAASEHAREESTRLLTVDPHEALRQANRAADLNDQSVAALVAKSAALARLGDYPAARAVLLTATRLEPHDFVPWGLLGDIAVRRGDFGAARRAYRRAKQLNPLDPFVGGLAESPASAIPPESRL